MDECPDRPLTPEEAKARLREVASGTGIDTLISEHPLTATAAGLVGGFLLGSSGRLSRNVRRVVIDALPLILRGT